MAVIAQHITNGICGAESNTSTPNSIKQIKHTNGITAISSDGFLISFPLFIN